MPNDIIGLSCVSGGDNGKIIDTAIAAFEINNVGSQKA